MVVEKSNARQKRLSGAKKEKRFAQGDSDRAQSCGVMCSCVPLP